MKYRIMTQNKKGEFISYKDDIFNSKKEAKEIILGVSSKDDDTTFFILKIIEKNDNDGND